MKQRNRRILHLFLVLAIITAVFLLLVRESNPDISFRLLVWISYLTLFWFPVILYQMIEYFIDIRKKRVLSMVFYFYAVAASLITALTPVSFYTRLTPAIEGMAVFIFVAALAKAFLAFLKKLPGAGVILSGSLIVGVAGVHDMIYQTNMIRSQVGELTPIGLIIFMFLLFLLISDRSSKTCSEVQSLSEELAEKLKLEQDLTERLYSLDKLKDGSMLDFLEPELTDRGVSYSILAVDDDMPSLQVLTDILHLANYHVKCAGSGKDALRLLENGAPFDLVILDVMMPEISGFEVLEALRGKYTRLELPVLMLTSKSKSDDMALCFRLGANDYLTKPFEVDELLARVSSLVKLKMAVNKLITTEMSFLQAQIKPHFIQNALSVISSLSIKDPHKAKALILDLSDYLRGSFELNNDEGLTTLSKELELVRAYLSIEQARFKERLQVHYHLIEAVDCALPLLTIQPLVENAIRHGIMCRMEGGEIHITTFLEPDRVRIEVRDNGIGIERDQIEQFFEMRPDRKGVGMANIHRRLMTRYGEGLHIESTPGQGTVVFFSIPYDTVREVPQ